MNALGVAPRRALAQLLAREVPRWHYRLWRLSRGHIGTHLRDVEFCLITTTGRRTGRSRTTPLVLIRTEEQLVLVASNGGNDRHPVWYLNLQSDPKACIETATERFAATTRIADSRERDELWPVIESHYAGYRNYRESTDREIPIIILNRRS